MYSEVSGEPLLAHVRAVDSPSRDFGLNDHERLVTKAELAEILGKSMSWIDVQIREMSMPWRPAGKRAKRFYVPDVLEWMEDTYGKGSGPWPGAKARKPSRGPNGSTYSLRRSTG